MAADPAIIEPLNAVLTSKLTGINQYFLHARILKHQGDMKLADYEYKASLDAMKHSDMLVEHILALGGLPNLQELDTLMIGRSAAEMMQNNLALLEIAQARLHAAIEACGSRKDSAALLTKILQGQQERMEFLRQQLIHFQRKECA
ncbi:MAG: bacterioferritin, partial [Pseudomonadota bacterium]|nr:bacterioferritin [Pseudomonadota bacterium]